MTTITLTLSDSQIEKAREHGLLSDEDLTQFIQAMVRERLESVAVDAGAGDVKLPRGYAPRLQGKVSPHLFGSVKVIGDIVAPLGIKWEAES